MSIIEKLGITPIQEKIVICTTPKYTGFDLSAVREVEQQRNELIKALEGMLKMYIQLVNCGDCGNWNPYEDKEVIASIKAMSEASKKTEDEIKALI